MHKHLYYSLMCDVAAHILSRSLFGWPSAMKQCNAEEPTAAFLYTVTPPHISTPPCVHINQHVSQTIAQQAAKRLQSNHSSPGWALFELLEQYSILNTSPSSAILAGKRHITTHQQRKAFSSTSLENLSLWWTPHISRGQPTTHSTSQANDFEASPVGVATGPYHILW